MRERGLRIWEVVAAVGGSALLAAGAIALFFTFAPACGADIGITLWKTEACDKDRANRSAKYRDERRERAALEQEIASLEREIGLLRCEPTASIVEPEPEPRTRSEEEIIEKAEPEPEEETEVAQCRPNQTVKTAEEVVFIIDTSGSMEYSIDLPAALDRRVLDTYEAVERATSRAASGDIAAVFEIPRAQQAASRALQQAEAYPGEPRMKIARQISTDAIQKAPDNLSLGLVTFNECQSRSHGSFPPSNRPDLVRRVRGLQAAGSTPLADAIRMAVSGLEGGATPENPVNIVLLSDGMDSCGGDPCAAARRAKQQKPGLVINVVNLSKVGDLQCVSAATGGFYRRHDENMDLAELARSIREAAGYEGEGLCRE